MSVVSTVFSDSAVCHPSVRDLTTPQTSQLLALESAPGHLIRRAHQLAVAQFVQSCAAFDLTSVQFAALTAIAQQSGVDQARLAAHLAFDVVTVSSVLQRLEAKQLITRTVDPQDKRKKCLAVTAAASALLARITPHASAAQAQILSPLSPGEQTQLMALLSLLVKGLEAKQLPSKISTAGKAKRLID